ncbi:DUF4304 domain-containing protein [Sorangium sp. So ce1014]|uniref:DUF4304 domain-containing protein n=1 Tax=Sorangium sp. So ce1014 TaxID=3133326 RepID=UPI003F5F6E09
MKTENPVKLATDAALKSAQFLRKSGTWYRNVEETVLIVDVQRSNFGQQYYINLGIFVKGLAQQLTKLPPKESECHIRLRLESLMPEAEEQASQALLDLENISIGFDERQIRIREAIDSVALPFLLQCSTRAGICEANRSGRLGSAVIHKSVRNALL